MSNVALKALFEDVSLGAPENAVGFVLWRVFHLWQREADRALAPLGLTHLQFTTLTMAAWLARSGEPISQAEIARAGEIHPMQISLMLKALETKGLVTRTRSRADVRAKCVEITTAGMATLRDALPVMVQVQRDLFGEEGRVGGSLLATLLGIEARRSDKD